jgi:hypothetical protein
LFEAGAITLSADREYVRTSFPEALSNAVKKLISVPTPTSKQPPAGDEIEFFVSAPGKVILFGEHAVVYGVVSRTLADLWLFDVILIRPHWLRPWISVVTAVRRPAMMADFLSVLPTSASPTIGRLMTFLGTPFCPFTLATSIPVKSIRS